MKNRALKTVPASSALGKQEFSFFFHPSAILVSLGFFLPNFSLAARRRNRRLSETVFVAMRGRPLARRPYTLMKDDFFDVVKWISRREKRVERLEENGCLRLGFGQQQAETHNELRGADSFEKTIEGVKNAVESGVTVGLAMMVMEDNLKDGD